MEEEGDAFVLHGQKTFISNGINGDLFVVAATPGFIKGKRLKKIVWHSQDTAELFFDQCRISKANRLGEKGRVSKSSCKTSSRSGWFWRSARSRRPRWPSR